MDFMILDIQNQMLQVLLDSTEPTPQNWTESSFSPVLEAPVHNRFHVKTPHWRNGSDSGPSRQKYTPDHIHICRTQSDTGRFTVGLARWTCVVQMFCVEGTQLIGSGHYQEL
ncbi:hypothetical protein CHARACLAT_009962 [Characodon lateralis]|uniref:Uncharacterized protein n=1 Tax=Characodon lateralis TaxID=208331 RepID=A0ABU7CMF1_9TELE|nr:hypothetical protein [Characodon lateralis]